MKKTEEQRRTRAIAKEVKIFLARAFVDAKLNVKVREKVKVALKAAVRKIDNETQEAAVQDREFRSSCRELRRCNAQTHWR